MLLTLQQPEKQFSSVCLICNHTSESERRLFPQAAGTGGGKISYYRVFHILVFHKPAAQYAQVWGLVFNLEQFSQVMGVICLPRQVAICI